MWTDICGWKGGKGTQMHLGSLFDHKGRNPHIPVSMLETIMSSYQYEVQNHKRMCKLELSTQNASLRFPSCQTQDWQPILFPAQVISSHLDTKHPPRPHVSVSSHLWMTWSSSSTWKPSITDFWLYLSYVNV